MQWPKQPLPPHTRALSPRSPLTIPTDRAACAHSTTGHATAPSARAGRARSPALFFLPCCDLPGLSGLVGSIRRARPAVPAAASSRSPTRGPPRPRARAPLAYPASRPPSLSRSGARSPQLAPPSRVWAVSPSLMRLPQGGGWGGPPGLPAWSTRSLRAQPPRPRLSPSQSRLHACPPRPTGADRPRP